LPLDDFGESFECPIDGYASQSFEDTRDTFLRLLKGFPSTFFVLDGLDELSKDGQSAALEFIRHLLQATLPIVKVLVTSRAEEYLIRKALQSYKSLEMSSAKIMGDISFYVEGALKSAAQKNTALSDVQLQVEVTNALVQGANGM
jgi:hypothetical protein